MSVVRCGVVPGSRWAQVNKDGVTSLGCQMRIVTDNKADDQNLILQSDLLPQLYEHHETNQFALCIGGKLKESAEAGEQGGVWLLDVEWTTDAIEKTENPLDEPTRYSLRWVQHEKVVERDINGDIIANTVGDVFFDPPYTQDDSRPVLVAVRNFPANQFEQLVAFALEYKDAISSDSYLGSPPKTAKMTDIQTGDLQVQNDIEFYRVTFEVQFNPDGWQPEILNRGHRAKDSSGNIYDLPNKEVRNLKEDGTLVGPNDEPHYVEFDTFNEKSFYNLGI